MEHPASPFGLYPKEGDVLDGKYRVERLLGEGGMGAVAKATHLLRRAPVALKFMSGAVVSLPGAVERFVNEGVAASQIDSDHVVKVFDVGRLPSGAPYLVMEFLDGRDLGDVIGREGPRIDPGRAVHFGLQMLRALHTAHGSGIVHRDMKPSNCFVIEKDGEADFLKLVDFGISKVRTTEDPHGPLLTRTNSALGTPLYMSPEQARSPRDVDHRTDLYSVGAILYQMLCGRTPYSSESGEYTEILYKIFTTEPAPVRSVHAEVPEGLARVVHCALTRDRDARFGSAIEMADALTPFADARSSALVARMRGGRSRSVGPHAWQVAETGPPARVPSNEADPSSLAPTFPSNGPVAMAVIGALGAPRVPTNVGVSRDYRNAPGTGAISQAKIKVGMAVMGLVVLAIAGGVAARWNHHGSTGPANGANGANGANTAEATTSAPSPLPEIPLPEVGTPRVAPVPTEYLAPVASVAPPPTSANAFPPVPRRTPSPSQSASAQAAQGTGVLPTQLGDLKLH